MLLAFLLAFAGQAIHAPKCGVPGQSWVTNDDYPADARHQGQQGLVEFKVDVDATGCPTACAVTKSTGFPLLDEKTCELIMARASYRSDPDGKPAIYTGKFNWVMVPDGKSDPVPWETRAELQYDGEGKLRSCKPADPAAERLAMLCAWSSSLSSSTLATLRSGKTGPFRVSVESAANFDGTPVPVLALPPDAVQLAATEFYTDRAGYVAECRSSLDPGAPFRLNYCTYMVNRYRLKRDKRGAPEVIKGWTTLVYRILD